MPAHHALEVARAPHLAVQRGTPVRPQDPEAQERDQQQGVTEERREAQVGDHGTAVVRRPQLDRLLVDVALGPEQVRGLLVERALEAAPRSEQHHDEHDGQGDHADVEADLLDLRVALHPQRDQVPRQHHRREDHDEQAVVGRQEVGQAVPLEGRGERLQHLDVEDVPVDRRPVPQDEPPAGDREDERDPSPHHAALPHVVPARTRHDRDQPRVGDDQERDEDPRDQQRGKHLSGRHEREHRQGEEQPQRHEVHRHERVQERVELGPPLDEAGRLAQEQGRSLTYRSHLHPLPGTERPISRSRAGSS